VRSSCRCQVSYRGLGQLQCIQIQGYQYVWEGSCVSFLCLISEPYGATRRLLVKSPGTMVCANARAAHIITKTMVTITLSF
jgi:hypothetical protein